MELYSNEAKQLQKQLEGWITHPARELEATFGAGGHVDQTRFLGIAQRLKARGYQEEPPKDYLTITIKDTSGKTDVNIRRDTLKNNTRFTIEGIDNIERYCNEESLTNLTYSTILKTPIGSPEDDLLLEDYDVKIKVRREMERSTDEAIVKELVLPEVWPGLKKAFRLIRRWTFKGDGCRFDLSMVRSNKKNASGAYVLTQNFQDEDQNIRAQPATYEIEVELLHGSEIPSVEAGRAKLIKAIGEVLRGLQKNTVLIRNSTKRQALDSYYTLVGVQQFRGVKPRTLEMKNFVSKHIQNTPNIRDGYNVTDKADGLRVLGFCNGEGELFLIDKALNVYRTGLKNPSCQNSLVDGEWITTIHDENDHSIQRSTNQLWLFDIYIGANKKVVDSLPFYSPEKDTASRYKALEEWHLQWVTNGPTVLIKSLSAANQLVVKLKTFEFATKKGLEIFSKAATMLGRKSEYNTDGLIFTSNSAPLPGPDSNFREQFKWKPAEDNTIDFLVRIEKDSETGTDLIKTEIRDDDKLVEYMTLILKVGSTMNAACANPRDTILYERDYPKGGCRSDKFYRDTTGKYKAVAFNPSDYSDPLASICKIEVQRDPDTQQQYIVTEKSNEPIRDRSIVEMRYDMSRPDGWRWVPVRVRVDKTEKLERGELSGSLNADFTAEGVWNSIHNPITKSMISTGNESPDRNEIEGEEDERIVDVSKPYFQRKANKQELQSVEGLRNFHKHYIKGDMLLTPTLKGGDKYLLDLAVGEGADINRWITNKVGFVYGIDIAAKGILDSHRGAYTKYINRLSENAGLPEQSQLSIPTMIFGIGDAGKSLATGEAGMNDEEANILRSVFGKVAPTAAVPPFVEHQGKDKLKDGADVIACMFALHYFFKDKATFQGLLNNLRQNLRVGGYFVACFFDGEKVFDLLKKKQEGDSVVGENRKSVLWRITKGYSNSSLPSDDTGFGLAIQNHFISIGSEHTEYLVPFELLKLKMQEIGCKVLTSEDLKSIGLPASTETFDVSYKRAQEKGREVFPMIAPLQQYSFLNRWCIFKRYGEEETNEEEEEKQANEEQQQEAVVAAPAAKTKAKSQAWADVPTSANEPPASILPAPTPEVRRPGPEPNAGTSALTRGVPTKEKPIQSLATAAAAAVVGVTALVGPQQKLFEKTVLFPFGPLEGNTDVLKEIDPKTKKETVVYPNAARYLAPYYPFKVIDNSNSARPVVYPSILHFMAGMEYKTATNKPDLAEQYFSLEGFIHRKAIEKMLLKGASTPPEQLKAYEEEVWKEEAAEIAKNLPIKTLKKNSLEYDEAKWIATRDSYLKQAYEQRYKKDADFHRILAKLRELNKVLLYRPTERLTTNLGGVAKLVGRGKDRKLQLEGDNKLGILLMTMAGFQGYKIESKSAAEEE